MAKLIHLFILIVLAISVFHGCGSNYDAFESEHEYVSDLEAFEVDATPLNSNIILKSPKVISIAKNGDIYVADMGNKKPMSVFSQGGSLLYKFGERGSGPGQIGSIRDIVAPSKGNDSTYVIEFDKKSIFVYLDSFFIRQYLIPGEGYPRFASLTNSGSIMLVPQD